MPLRWISIFIGLGLLVSCFDEVIDSNEPIASQDSPYHVENIRFSGGAAGVDLEGELTLPFGVTPFPAVILISGAGPHDRDSSIFGYRPFRLIADHLSRRGFAVLRYDDRGVGESSGDFRSATLNDFAADAISAYDFARSRPEIDNRRIGFLGHSEGGYVAPVAAQQVNADFMVFLAGPSRPLLPDVMMSQVTDLLEVEGASKDTINRERHIISSITELLQQSSSAEDVRGQMRNMLERAGANRFQVHQNLELWATEWGRYYAGYDPLPALREFRGPVLALYGERDLQVSARENADIMQRALQNPASKVVVLPRLNHWFQNANTGRIEEYRTAKNTIDPSVLSLVSNWLLCVSDRSRVCSSFAK